MKNGSGGLRGVIVADTCIGEVRGEEGFYHYREFSGVELAQRRPLEDVWFLLLNGHLPNACESDAFTTELCDARHVSQKITSALAPFGRAGVSRSNGGGLFALRTALSLLAATEDFAPSLDAEPSERRRQAVRIMGAVPTLIGQLYRAREGLDPVEPLKDGSAAHNYLYLISGTEPPSDVSAALEKYLVATVDHGFNASTFTCRVITSTGADLGSAVVGALGALSGPLHGGAPSRVLDFMDNLDSSNLEKRVTDVIEGGGRVMGFGQAVYREADPRTDLLRDVALSLGGQRIELAHELEKTVKRVFERLKHGRQIFANVELYAAVLMERCGIPRPLFTPTFAVSRVGGWCAHALEQASDGRLMRPSANYVGPPPPQPVPDAEQTRA